MTPRIAGSFAALALVAATLLALTGSTASGVVITSNRAGYRLDAQSFHDGYIRQMMYFRPIGRCRAPDWDKMRIREVDKVDGRHFIAEIWHVLRCAPRDGNGDSYPDIRVMPTSRPVVLEKLRADGTWRTIGTMRLSERVLGYHLATHNVINGTFRAKVVGVSAAHTPRLKVYWPLTY